MPPSYQSLYGQTRLLAVLSMQMPDWLRPLHLRGRVAFVDQYRADSVTSFTEYRVILNYEVTWNGTRR